METQTTLHAHLWQEALSGDREILVPELPGYGESDRYEGASIDDHADAVAAMLGILKTGTVDVLSIGLAAPLALSLATRHPDRVGSLILDGIAQVGAAVSAEQLCPMFKPDFAGGHWHRTWHMVRDAEVQWPWFDSSVPAQRTLVPCLAAEPLHRAMLDILKQPTSYGDVALAGLNARPVALPTVPIILFDRPGDADYSGVKETDQSFPGAKIVARPADIAAAAGTLVEILR